MGHHHIAAYSLLTHHIAPCSFPTGTFNHEEVLQQISAKSKKSLRMILLTHPVQIDQVDSKDKGLG